ncbi:unnamed protein product [Leptidea sinapis]|uniref:BTB domain-containing protein n=1 Tax=Leptidea sinapis TaxID=189913 RepID=A0A5E4QHK1_9NEOP|nr:unnamed protein product [Leptidea sinapis]
MANQEISLKWNGYQNNILHNVKELFKDEGLSDVTLVSEGHSFKAHKVILSANSAVFRTIFQQNPHKDPIIVLHDINTSSLRTLLTFMYNGEVNVTEEFLPVLLKTAEALRISGLSTGSEINQDDEKASPILGSHTKKRKKSNHEDSNSKVKKKLEPLNNVSSDVLKNCNVLPKVEPIDSPLTDYSGDNTNDTDIAVLDESDKRYRINLDLPNKSTTNESTKKGINEVSSTQPCLNNVCEKISSDCDKEMEIDKEVETVLQSGTLVESLNITTENLKLMTNEAIINQVHAMQILHFHVLFVREYITVGATGEDILSCKWCVTVLSSTGAWYSHATKTHGVPHEEARNSLVVMVEAHAVLTLNEPSVAQLLGQVGIDASGTVSEKLSE